MTSDEWRHGFADIDPFAFHSSFVIRNSQILWLALIRRYRRSTRFIDPQALTRIASLELVARTVVEGFISGLHRSPHLGFSVNFAEYRAYRPGDDIRKIDWKVYGRTDRFFVKGV